MPRTTQADMMKSLSPDAELRVPLSKLLGFISEMAVAGETGSATAAEMFRILAMLECSNLPSAQLISELCAIDYIDSEFPELTLKLHAKAQLSPFTETLGATFVAELGPIVDLATRNHVTALVKLMPFVPDEPQAKILRIIEGHDRTEALYWPIDDIRTLICMEDAMERVPGLTWHCWQTLCSHVCQAIQYGEPITDFMPIVDDRFKYVVELCLRAVDKLNKLNKKDSRTPTALMYNGEFLQLAHKPAIKAPEDPLEKVALIRQSEILSDFADQLLPGPHTVPDVVHYNWKLLKFPVSIELWLKKLIATALASDNDFNLWLYVFDYVAMHLLQYLGSIMSQQQQLALGRFFLHVFGELFKETRQVYEHEQFSEILERAITRTVQLLETLEMPIAVETNPLELIPKVRQMLKVGASRRKRALSIETQISAEIEEVVISDDDSDPHYRYQQPKRSKEDANDNEEMWDTDVKDKKNSDSGKIKLTPVDRMAWGVNFFTGRLYDVEKLSGTGRLMDDAGTTWIDAEWSEGTLVFFNQAQVLVPSEKGDLLFRLSEHGQLSCNDYNLHGQLEFYHQQLLFNTKWNVSHFVRHLVLTGPFHYFDELVVREDYGEWLRLLHDRRQNTYTSMAAARDIQLLGVILRNWRPRENLDALHLIAGTANEGMSAEFLAACSRLYPHEEGYMMILDHPELRRQFKPPIPFSLLLEIREAFSEAPDAHRDAAQLAAFRGCPRLVGYGPMALQEVHKDAVLYLRPPAVAEMMRVAQFAKADMQVFHALWVSYAAALFKLFLRKAHLSAGENIVSPFWPIAVRHLFAQRDSFAELSGIPKRDLLFLDTGEVLRLHDAVDPKWTPWIFCSFKRLEFAFKTTKALFPLQDLPQYVLAEIDSVTRFVGVDKAALMNFECRFLLATLRYVMHGIEERGYVPQALVPAYRELLSHVLRRSSDFLDVAAPNPAVAFDVFVQETIQFLTHVAVSVGEAEDWMLEQMALHVSMHVDEPSDWPDVFDTICEGSSLDTTEGEFSTAEEETP